MVYVGLVRLDSILLQPFAERLHDPFFASGGRHRFKSSEIFLRSLEAGGKTNYLAVVRQFLDTYPQKGLVMVISDFLDDGDCLRPLQYLSDFGHELLLMQVWGEEDRAPSDEGEMELIDAESGEHIKIALDEDARHSYTESFDEYAGQVRTLALRNGGRYAGITTHTAVEDAVFGPMITRGQ